MLFSLALAIGDSLIARNQRHESDHCTNQAKEANQAQAGAAKQGHVSIRKARNLCADLLQYAECAGAWQGHAAKVFVHRGVYPMPFLL